MMDGFREVGRGAKTFFIHFLCHRNIHTMIQNIEHELKGTEAMKAYLPTNENTCIVAYIINTNHTLKYVNAQYDLLLHTYTVLTACLN